MKRRTSEKSLLRLLWNSCVGRPILRHGVFIHMENELWNLVSKSCPTWVHEAASSFLMVKNVEFISVPPLSRVGGHRYLRGRRASTALSVKLEGQAGSTWLGHLGVEWVFWGWVPLKALWGVGVLGQDPETWETRKQDIVFFVNEEQGGNYLISPNPEMSYSWLWRRGMLFLLQFHSATSPYCRHLSNIKRETVGPPTLYPLGESFPPLPVPNNHLRCLCNWADPSLCSTPDWLELVSKGGIRASVYFRVLFLGCLLKLFKCTVKGEE